MGEVMEVDVCVCERQSVDRWSYACGYVDVSWWIWVND